MVAPNVNGRLHLTVVHQNPTAYLVLKGDKKKLFLFNFLCILFDSALRL